MDKNLNIGLFVVIGGLISGCHGVCTTTYVPPATMLFDVIVDQELVVVRCPDPKVFSTDDVALTVQCIDEQWQTFQATCIDTTGSIGQCGSDPEETNAVLEPNPTSTLFRVFSCVTGMHWLSGAKKQVTQCRGTDWTPILDVCDTACEVPRECSAVAALGFNTSGWYNVIPSGNINDPAHKVYCMIDIDDPETDQGWTLVLFNDGEIMQKSVTDYLKGFGNISEEVASFIGLEALAGWGREDDQIPMRLEVILTSSNEMNYTSLYSNFITGPAPNFPLQDIGEYHGNGGDAMCPHVHTDFLPYAIDPTQLGHYWWGLVGGDVANADGTEFSTLITNQYGCHPTKENRWESFKDAEPPVTISKIYMRAKPVSVDRLSNCPPIVGTDPNWMYTYVNFINGSNSDRRPGQEIHYYCDGDLQFEGMIGEERSNWGVLVCQDDFTWDKNVSLPCTLDCSVLGPEYNMSNDGTFCVKYSEEPVDNLVVAAQKCLKDKATLGFLTDEYDLVHAKPNTQYLTSYVGRGETDPAFVIDPKPGFEGQASVLWEKGPADCVVVSYDGTIATFGMADCEEPGYHYICKRPGDCPETYTNVDGGCYKILPADGMSLFQTYEQCAKEGAGLFYPNEESQFEPLNQFVNLTDGEHIFLGINNALPLDDWTHNGTYEVSPEVVDMIDESEPGRWVIGSYSDANENISLWTIPSPLEPVEESKRAVCQLHAPVECGNAVSPLAPPAPIEDMVTDWDNETIAASMENKITYTCSPGYFVNASVPNKTQDFNCLGQLGGWFSLDYESLQECIAVPVCEGLTGNHTLEPDLVTNKTYDDSFYLNGTITYNCPPKMGRFNDTEYFGAEQNTTCSEIEEGMYDYAPKVLFDCDVCIFNETFENATTTFQRNTHRVGDKIVAQCEDNHEFAYNDTDGSSVSTQECECTPSGWNRTNVINACHGACTYNPALGLDNMERDNITHRGIGQRYNYTCAPGYNIRPTQNYSEPSIDATYTYCNESHTWAYERPDDKLECVKVCQEPPPESPEFSTREWDGFTRSENDTVVYTCDPSYLNPNYSHNMTFKCNGTHWVGPDEDTFKCKQVCMKPVNATHGGGIGDWPSGDDYMPAFVGEIANYSCPDRQATKFATYNTSIVCDADGNWTVPDSSFRCYNACEGPPPPPPAFATYNYTETDPDYTDGTLVTYTCYGYFSTGNLTLDTVCSEFNWTLFDIPECNIMTTLGPYDPIYLPVGPDFEVAYSETSDFHAAMIADSMHGANGIKDDYETTSGPTGFSSGVALSAEKHQCMMETKLIEDPCLYNPRSCTNGISISLWQKIIFDGDVFTSYKNRSIEDRKYILSTGGDEFGHPGISIAFNGLILEATVSTGEECWHHQGTTNTPNNTWQNVAIRWKYPSLLGNGKYIGGLQVFIMGDLVGSIIMSSTISAKEPLKPQTTMIGCHKTSTNAELVGFNNNEYSELAMWMKYVPDNETVYFLGGYNTYMAQLSTSDFKNMIDRIPIADKDQFGAASDFLIMSTVQTIPPTNSGNKHVSSTPAAPVDESDTEPANEFPQPSSEEINKLKDIGEIMGKMLDITKLPDQMNLDDMCGRMDLLKVISNVASNESTNTWRAIHKNHDESGIAGIVSKFEKWVDYGLHKVTFNNSKPIRCNKVTDNIILQTSKLKIEDFLVKGSLAVVPNHRDISITEEVLEKWDFPSDRLEFPTAIFDNINFDCATIPVILKSALYGALGPMIPTQVNPVYTDSSKSYTIDSRVFSVNLESDEPSELNGMTEEMLKLKPRCKPDLNILKKNPVRYQLRHIDKEKARTTSTNRKLMFHENELTSNIMVRKCAWWNSNLSDFGGWDVRGCEVVESTDISTKCVCERFGIFGILAELVPTRNIPEELLWLTTFRYIGYSISAGCLIFYIIVVLMNNHLREQFHLLGMNLCISILLGSICMVISDFSFVRDDRHACVAVGTLIHYFYAVSANWITIFGHSAFRAITAGVVNGYLKAYVFICWGLGLVFVGVPYIYDVHMLGTDPRCFVSWDTLTKLLFLGPQVGFSTLALIFGIIVLFNLTTPALRKDSLIEDYGSFCEGGAYVMIYFALTWFFGTAANIETEDITMDFYPIFQLFNACTGIFIFAFIGLFSNRFYTALTGQVFKRKIYLKNNPFGKKVPPITKDTNSRKESGLATSRPSIRPVSVPAELKAPSTGSSVAGRPISRPLS